LPSARPLKLLFVLLVLGMLPGQAAMPQPLIGPQGAEGAPDRAQSWLIPSPDPNRPAPATLFRPAGDGPFRLALIAPAAMENAPHRAQMPQPDYHALVSFLTARGFAVLVPERLGHGATGGRSLEDQDGCDMADDARSARATAAEIALAHEFMRAQSFVQKEEAVIIGDSAGGWGALALAHESPNIVAAIIAFTPGRSGRANDAPGQACAPEMLIAAAAEFGKTARVPVTWLVAANDTYFSPELSRRLAEAFRKGGGKVAFRVLAASGREGHWVATTEAGVQLAGSELDRALKGQPPIIPRKQ
jgi:dienelactone hydrolase